MKKKLAKIAALSMAAVSLVLVTVLVTVAFLTSSSKVENTFTVGDVAITMSESPVDANGQKVANSTKNTNGNKYRLIPGKSYCKDPSVFVEGNKEKAYLFVTISNGISEIETTEEAYTMVGQMKAKGWKEITISQEETVYVYAKDAQADDYATPVGGVAEDQEISVFDTFTLRQNAELTDQYASAKVTLCAYAIQADTFLNTEEGVLAAWNAVKGVETP